jgi:hypothetical protein
MRTWKWAWIALPALILVGCTSPDKVDVSKLGPPPSTTELAAMHNARIKPISTLWARVSVRAKGTYSDGDSYEEQGEGHLQISKPSKVSLTIGKLGETYFAYGANAQQYWSFNLSNSDNKTLLIGNLDQASPEKSAALGLPVHPSELIALSGLMPIDLARAGGTRWADDGKSVGVTVPSHWGSFTLWIDPRTNLAVSSQVFDHADNLVATASLSRYKDAAVPEHGFVLVPGKIEITSPNDTGFVRIEISEPSSKAIRSIVFDPNKLARAYRVDETIDLDGSFQRSETMIDSEQQSQIDRDGD